MQEMWLYARIQKDRRRSEDHAFDMAKMICTFVNPGMAKSMFDDRESVENTGFFDDIKKLDPSIDVEQFQDMLGE